MSLSTAGEVIRILFVEDEPTDTGLAVMALEDAGMRVEARRVETRDALLSDLTDFEPHLILLDVSLPHFDGIQALGIAREEAPEVPVLMFTGAMDEATVSQCIRGGALDFVPKTHLLRLPSAVSAALERRREEEERRLAQETVRKSEERFRSLAETANDTIIAADREGIIQFVNRAVSATFGYDRDELMGKPVTILMPEDLREDHQRAWDLAVRGGRRRMTGTIQEVTGLRRDGTPIPLEISVSTGGTVEDGEFFAFLRDISERKAAEEALEALILHHELVLSSVSEGILVIDGEGITRFMNPATTSITGWEEEDLLGRSIHEILHRGPEKVPTLEGGDRSIMAPLKDRRQHSGNAVFLKKGGGATPVSFSSSPFEAPDGTQGAVVVFEDKSERETLESQLRQAQKMEAVGQLTGGIAHDFNNLLTVILLHAEAMESFLTPADSGLRSSLKDIQEAAERAAVMTRKLLGFSRRAPLKPVPLDVVKVARGMASMIRRVLPETIEFSLAAHGDVAPIKGDAGAVEQILLNLATNARDAMRSGGQLNIDVREVELSLAFADEHPWANPGPHVKISVQDSGTGMDQHTLEKVFDPFFTTKEVGEGTGLGLAMVYGLMKQQGGFVQAESEVGVGTTISLYFPELPSIASIQEKEMEEELEFAGNETILVVEDDRSLRQVASETLARNGYKVVEAGNGEEAMALLLSRRKEINLVLTDIVMPRMGGIALHEKTREMGLNVPFLFTSGYLGGAGGGATLPENGPPFVAKPWNKRTLLRSLRRLLDRDGLGEWAREGSCDC